MKTGYAILTSILIASIILLTGLMIYMGAEEVRQHGSASNIPNPLMNADFQTEDIMDENGEVTGQRGYVEISRAELESISAGQLLEFAEKQVRNSSLQWVSVMTPEGDGIYFPDSNYEYGEYGILTDDGRIDSLHASITLENNTYQFNGPDGAGAALITDGNDSTESIINDDSVNDNIIENEEENTIDDLNSNADIHVNKTADYISEPLGIQFTAPDGYQMTAGKEISELSDMTADFFSASPELAQLLEESDDGIESEYREMTCAAPSGDAYVSVTTTVLSEPLTLDEFITFVKSLMLFSGSIDWEDLEALEWVIDKNTGRGYIAGKEFTKSGPVTIQDTDGNKKIQEYYFIKQDNTCYYILFSYTSDKKAEADVLLNAFLPR